jgi:hypothetical protein
MSDDRKGAAARLVWTADEVVVTPPEELTVCERCSALIPATEEDTRKHLRHHEQVDSHDPR